MTPHTTRVTVADGLGQSAWHHTDLYPAGQTPAEAGVERYNRTVRYD